MEIVNLTIKITINEENYLRILRHHERSPWVDAVNFGAVLC